MERRKLRRLRYRLGALMLLRFQITDNADLILFMEDGQVKEEGDHASLMAQDGSKAFRFRFGHC